MFNFIKNDLLFMAEIKVALEMFITDRVLTPNFIKLISKIESLLTWLRSKLIHMIVELL